jgi:uncharacterized membrane protein
MHTRFDEVFRISIIIKGIDGLIETIGGLLLLIATPASIQHLADNLTRHELSTDPHDFIATFIMHSAHNLTATSTIFGAIYLLAHGLIKIGLVIALLYNKLWAYPAMLVVLLIFIVYQLIRLNQGFSWGLTILTVFDGFVFIMTWLEGRKQLILRREIRESES